VVLVVEDEAKLRKVAVNMLERLGLRSLQAETAKDALELLGGTRVDVLFTDIELPGGMNGTELAEAAHELDPNIKVLFTTGYARETVLHDRWAAESPLAAQALFAPGSELQIEGLAHACGVLSVT
jgi:CheY-like chemotaxis protein